MSPRYPKVWLALIVAIYLLLVTLYAVQVPAWQAPDEPAHYNYVHELATTGQFPVLRMGDYDQAYLDQLKAARFPPELSIAGVRYEAHQPPLYYLLAGPVFRVTGGELTALRLFSAVLGALLVVLTYAIAATIFPGRVYLALGAAAFVAFLPMHLAMAASVNNDALAEVLLAAVLLLSIRYVRLAVLGPRSPGGWDALILGLLLGLALITKVSAYVAAPIALAALLVAWYEARRQNLAAGYASRFTVHLILVFLPALLIALPWYVRNASVYGHMDILARRWHDTVVVGQLRTSELLAQAGPGGVLERFVVWSHDSFWGVFGWMGVWMDGRIYTLLLAFSLAVLAGCVALAARKARQPRNNAHITHHGSRFQTWSLALLALSALLTLGIYVSYNLIFVQPQGRYLFPALPAIGLAVALGWHEALRPAAARWAGLVLIASAALAGVIGWLRAGVNTWSVALLGGAGAAFLAWSLAAARFSTAWRRRLTVAAFVLPFALLALLDGAALVWFILPQLA
ncbi:MAG: glycosyltransferase family 39 protein [Caldilineales bacterium]